MFAARLVSSAARLMLSPLQQSTRTCAFMPQQDSLHLHVGGLIDEKIQQNKVMIFSKSFCPFCSKAKRVFTDLVEENHLKPDEIEVMEIEDNEHCDLIQDHLQKMTGAKSVPRVFINQQFVGGGDDVVKAYAKGDLHKLLS